MPPPTLFEYLPEDALLFIDESHVMIPQIRAMYNGDRARKTSLVEYGFRLPSALDNRPLKFDEWEMLKDSSQMNRITRREKVPSLEIHLLGFFFLIFIKDFTDDWFQIGIFGGLFWRLAFLEFRFVFFMIA